MEPFKTTAWSFVNDAPVEEIIPVKIKWSHKDLIEWSTQQDIAEETREKIKKIMEIEDVRHLGLTLNIDADTDTTGRKIINNIKRRLG